MTWMPHAARIAAAGGQLLGTLGQVQQRLTPSNLAQDAMDSAAQGVATVARKGAEAVRDRPSPPPASPPPSASSWRAAAIGDILSKRHETRDPATGLKRKGKKGSS